MDKVCYDDGWPYGDEPSAEPACRICGHELTTSSELLDNTCIACFRTRREDQ